MRGKAWAAVAVGAGLALGSASPGRAQGLYPPAQGSQLQQLSGQMAEAVRALSDDIVAGLGQTPAGQYLARDAQELQRSTGEWYVTLGGATDPYQVRRSYSGIDGAWHRLRGQLSAPGVATPAVVDEIARVDQVDGQIHRSLNLNAYPPNFDAAPAAPTGLDETRRLAYSLAQRGEALASAIQNGYGGNPNPTVAMVVNDSAELARLVDSYYDAMSQPGAVQQPEDARQGFAQVVQKSNSLGVALGSIGMPPQVKSAWDAYTSVHNLIRGQLNLVAATPNGLPDQPPPPVGFNGGFAANPNPVAVGIPYVANQVGPVAQWADQLDRQVDELLANFAPTAQVVPEGRDMLAEMARLRDDARNFRGDASQNLDAGRLAYEFREVDADWQRLARRFARVGRGRFGPNIQRVQEIGQTCEQIHRALGMPGYPPAIIGYQ